MNVKQLVETCYKLITLLYNPYSTTTRTCCGFIWITLREWILLRVGARVMSFVFILICLSATISLIRTKGGERGRWSSRDREKKDGEVLSTRLSHKALPPRRPLAPFLCCFCSIVVQNISHLAPSLRNSTGWGYNNISPIHQAQPALINKHFESTPQHRTKLKMSPLCLCQYLSLCWQSYLRLRGGRLLQ